MAASVAGQLARRALAVFGAAIGLATLPILAEAQAPPDLTGAQARRLTQDDLIDADAKGMAKNAQRDFERAFENTRPIDAPDWKGTGPAPIEMFISRPSVDLVRMTPDGKHVAAVRRDNGVSYLMVVDLDAPTAPPKALKLEGMNVSNVMWASNDRLLYVAGAEKISFKGDVHGVVMVGAPRLYSTGLDLKNSVLLFENDKRLSRENFGSAQPIRIRGDDRHVMIPMRLDFELDLLKVNIYDSTWEIAAKGETATTAWFVDRDGRPVMRFDRGNVRAAQTDVMVRADASVGAGGEMKWRKAQTIRIDAERANTPDFEPLSAGPTPTQFYIKGRPSSDVGTIGVYLYDVSTKAFSQVFSNPTADVDQVVFDPDTGAFAGAFYWEDRLKFEFADPALRAQMGALDDSFRHAWNVVPIERSTGNKRWLVRVSNAANPGGYYIYDPEAKTANEIGQLQPLLLGVQPGQVFAVGYAAHDGTRIGAYLTTPPGWTDKSPKPPLIVMPHGGPEARDTYDYNPLVQFLASRGYAVFQPNFRGSTGYGQALQVAGRRHWGDAMQDDITDGVKFLLEKGFADPARICIFGASYGGYAALMGAVQHPELYKCAVSASGPADLSKMLKWEREQNGSDSLPYKYWVSQMGDPGDDHAAIEAASPALHADRVQHPVLLIHGRKDMTVPYEQSEIMLAALKKAGKPVDLVTFETAAHGFIGRDDKRFFSKLENFFGANLGVAPVPLIGPPIPEPDGKH